MKLFRSLIATSSLLALSSASFAQEAKPAAASSTSCNNCMMPCNWDLSKERFYVGGGASYIYNNKFHGWGGSGHLGYFFHKNHALELELNYFHEEADRSVNRVAYNAKSGGTPGGTPGGNRSIDSKLSARLEQWPLMLNYRYHGSFADFGCGDNDWMKRVLFNVGAGVGVNFARAKSTWNDVLTDISDKASSPVVSPIVNTDSSKKTHTEFAAQIFAQLGYAVTENLSVLGGLRGFWTDKFTFGNGNYNKLTAESSHLVFDLGVNWRF